MVRSLIPFLLVACQTATPVTQTTPPKDPPATGSAETPTPDTAQTGSASPKPAPADAVACETNKDCDRHACGPCNKGDVLTQHDVSIKCFRNPCPMSTVSCQNHVCTVD